MTQPPSTSLSITVSLPLSAVASSDLLSQVQNALLSQFPAAMLSLQGAQSENTKNEFLLQALRAQDPGFIDALVLHMTAYLQSFIVEASDNGYARAPLLVERAVLALTENLQLSALEKSLHA